MLLHCVHLKMVNIVRILLQNLLKFARTPDVNCEELWTVVRHEDNFLHCEPEARLAGLPAIRDIRDVVTITILNHQCFELFISFKMSKLTLLTCLVLYVTCAKGRKCICVFFFSILLNFVWINRFAKQEKPWQTKRFYLCLTGIAYRFVHELNYLQNVFTLTKILLNYQNKS